ncbi:helix-turn-helix domain-containing protein [Nocardia sp. alder85J]|uniref:helix-turn-helix domain-containing protein n=1 Tax=Nocardia sp. alder85J TaxID=2862949 RepID=UPI001CD6CAC0|nr:helix-turn-helix domain-containing protein [Nocardia sp. alder85J]MCX4098340.1 helix-turn-helix domain-containing protein [Nocardia sp. alder85J]
MNARTVKITVGTSLLFDGEMVRVAEFDGRTVTVCHSDGRYSGVALAQFVSRARGVESFDDGAGDPGLVLSALSPAQRNTVSQRAEHVREVLTGYRAGYADAAVEGEPRPEYIDTAMKDRYRSKAAELGISVRTVEYWVAAYRAVGEAGLVDDRARKGLRTSVDPRWDTAVAAEMAAGVGESTRSRSALLKGVAERLEREHGAGVVALPSQATAYRRLEVLAKGTNAVSGSAKGRRSIAERPQGVYGRLRATRPGEYVVLDTQDLDVFAMEPVTCRWLRAQLTVAQDLFDRQILGLKVTAVSTKAVDVAGVLFEAVTGRGSGRPTLGPLHGLPDRLVFSEFGDTETEVWCPPETLVIDHGRAFLSAHVIGVCARMGISIQPAQPRKPTDKPTVERFFRSLREGLIQHLPAYKGPDLHSRGIDLEGQAFLFLHELEDVIRDWIVTVYHRSGHDGLVVAQRPELGLSPNDMFAVGLAKSGVLRIPAEPELALEFLRVEWRTIQHYGVEIDGRRYNGEALNPYRNRRSDYGGTAAGKWPLRVNDDDVRSVWFRDPGDGCWHRLEWEHAAMLGMPFSAEAARYARTLTATENRFVDPAQALAEVLNRWSAGEVIDRRERRMAARLSAERSGLQAVTDLDNAAAAPAAAMLGGTVGAEIRGDDDAEDELFDDPADEPGEDYWADAMEVLE